MSLIVTILSDFETSLISCLNTKLKEVSECHIENVIILENNLPLDPISSKLISAWLLLFIAGKKVCKALLHYVIWLYIKLQSNQSTHLSGQQKFRSVIVLRWERVPFDGMSLIVTVLSDFETSLISCLNTNIKKWHKKVIKMKTLNDCQIENVRKNLFCNVSTELWIIKQLWKRLRKLWQIFQNQAILGENEDLESQLNEQK